MHKIRIRPLPAVGDVAGEGFNSFKEQIMSEEITAIKLHQPDIDFVIWYIPFGHQSIKIYCDPFTIEASMVSKKEAEQAIKKFDAAINGGDRTSW